MDTTLTPPTHDLSAPAPVEPSPLSRRGFLRGAALAGGGLVAVGVAACAPAANAPAGWTFGPVLGAPGASGSPSPSGSPASSPSHSVESPGPSGSPGPSTPAGWSDHDLVARHVVRRYLGNLVPALEGIYGTAAFAKLGGILGAADNYPELAKAPAFMSVGPQLFLKDALEPLTPELDGDVKVFRLTIDEIELHIDELAEPIKALGYNGQVPGPTIRVKQGDRVRAIFTNNLKETTGVHFHGMAFDDFFQDGVPFVTQLPIVPGETYTYEFVARSSGSLMYHSHHNATDQVGRGLLGAFIVEPAEGDPVAYDREYVWISNDVLGGFTVNGHGFPATVPILAAVGETVRVRFMNEGVMMHPFHSHGFVMNVIARDGRPLGNAAFECDTLGVNPGERWDVLIKVDRPGVWAFHCHILPHVEGAMGMFGMVNTIVAVPEKAHVDAIVQALLAGAGTASASLASAAGSIAKICAVPTAG